MLKRTLKMCADNECKCWSQVTTTKGFWDNNNCKATTTFTTTTPTNNHKPGQARTDSSAGRHAPTAAHEEGDAKKTKNKLRKEIRAEREKPESIFIQRRDNCEAVIKLVCHISFHYPVEPGWKWSKKAPFSSGFHFLYDSE